MWMKNDNIESYLMMQQVMKYTLQNMWMSECVANMWCSVLPRMPDS